ncbi:hypothetical protein [Paenibacillus planticolens]|uniref:hypothetical protein n=1 Tax=Paenibacillus planticolens TaxID=2654976 RepID=UPI001C10785F|nr:hypothetical protein [Paenibacillus planticolens]
MMNVYGSTDRSQKEETCKASRSWKDTEEMSNYDTSIVKIINALEKGVWKSEPAMKALNKIVQMRDKGFIDKGTPALNHTDSQSQWLHTKWHSFRRESGSKAKWSRIGGKA